MNNERGPWYLLTGLVLGAALGLLYAWVIQPVEYTDTAPASLRADFKDQYRALIAAAYQANGDLVRARARLELLGDEDLYRALAEQAQRTLAGGGSLQEARLLGLLAVALGQSPAAPNASPTAPTEGASPSPPAPTTPALALSPTPTLSPTSTLSTAELSTTLNTPSPTAASPTPFIVSITPLPTRTPTPLPAAPFVLKSEELVCNPALGQSLIQVQAYDAAGQGVPAVEVVVTWEGGENHFFTGLKPEFGPGYADFSLTPGITYTLRLAQGGQPIPNLSAPECQSQSGERYWGTWLLTFVQP